MMPTIQTAGGGYFDFVLPDTAMINIEDIAHALAQINRFTGHAREPYNVAQHSVYVSHLVPQQDMLAGLLHDAHEAYIGDVSAPLKQLLPDYRALERRIENRVRFKFGLQGSLPPSVKHADLIMLNSERQDLMPPSEDDVEWSRLHNIGRAPFKVVPWSFDKSKEEFLHRFYKLTIGMFKDGVPV